MNRLARRVFESPGFARNLAANFVGRLWTAATYLVCAPLYLEAMGIEAYGLVGFFLTLVALSSILELGLSTTLNRELSRHAASGRPPESARDLLRTLEWVYWGLSLVIAGVVAAASPWLAESWFDSSDLSHGTVQEAILIMAAVLLFQWPLSLYAGGLMGLQRQVALNAVVVVMMTVRNGGALLVLWTVSSTVEAFFAWQLVATAAQALITAGLLWRFMPSAPGRAVFRRAQVRQVWRFAAGVSLNGILVVILTQLDKVVLSGVLSLEDFGYYSLAWLVASALVYLVLPVFQASFPRLSALVAQGDRSAVERSYHRDCQLMAVVVIPVASVVALFSAEILQVWTGDAGAADEAGLLTALLIVGTALNALMNMPYALSLAYGWTRFSVSLNLGVVLAFVPALLAVSSSYGATGAAATWVAVNAAYVLVGIQILHRRLLPGQKLRWYVDDVALPVGAAVGVALLGRALLPAGASDLLVIVGVVVTTLASVTCALAAAPFLRRDALRIARPAT